MCSTNITNAAGVVDGSFNPSPAIGNNQIIALRGLPDGKVVVMGSRFFKRLNEDGSDDATYTEGNISSSFGADMGDILGDGTIILGGRPLEINGTDYGNIVRILPDGTVDSSFTGPSIPGSPGLRQIKVDNDGFIYLNGGFFSIDGLPLRRLARLNSDGSLDPNYRSEQGVFFNSFVDLFQNNDLLLASTDSPDRRIVRLNSAGDSPGFATVLESLQSNLALMHVTPNGRVVFGASTYTGTGVLSNSLARVLSNGVVDRGFEPREVFADGTPLGGLSLTGRRPIWSSLSRRRIPPLRRVVPHQSGSNLPRRIR